MKMPNLFQTAVAIRVLLGIAPTQALAQDWPGYGHDPQHTTVSAVASQIPQQVRWSTPVDLDPQYANDGDLYIHYGTPVITAANTVILPVKTGAASGFQVEARSGNNRGALLWTLPTDYAVPVHNWFPICGATLLPGDGSLAVPAAGGTVLVQTSPDSAAGTATRLAFYGIGNYNGNQGANKAAYDAAIQICTPISSDATGNLYFGYVSSGAALPGDPAVPGSGYPNGIPSGLARISSSGAGSS